MKKAELLLLLLKQPYRACKTDSGFTRFDALRFWRSMLYFFGFISWPIDLPLCTTQEWRKIDNEQRRTTGH